LTGESRARIPPQPLSQEEESLEDLERQLQSYFERATPEHSAAATSSRTQLFDELRRRVIDGVVDRILAEWADPQRGHAGTGLGQEVMNRLIERVFEEFRKMAEESPQR
jgi:hypothetical protein